MAEDTTPAMGRLLGTNNLQRSIDAFSRTVDTLKSVVGEMGSGRYQTGSGPNAAQWTNGPRSQGGGSANNGGGATFSGSAKDRYWDTMIPPGGSRGGGQGGGASNNGGHGRNIAGAVIGGMVGAGRANMSDQVTRDYVTQYARTVTGGGYGSTLRTMNGNSVIGNSAADRMAAVQSLNSNLGYGVGTSQWGSAYRSYQQAGLMNPTMSGAQIMGVSNEYASAGAYNRLQMYGVRSMSMTGDRASMGSIAMQMARATGYDPNSRYSKSTIAQIFDNQNSGYRQTLALSGLSQDAQDAQLQYMRNQAVAASNGMSVSDYNRLTTTGAQADKAGADARKRLDQAGVHITNTALQSMKTRIGAQENVQDNMTQGFADGLKTANDALNKFTNALAAATNGPLGRMAGFGQGAGATIAGALSSGGGGFLGAVLGGKGGGLLRGAMRFGGGGGGAGGAAEGGGLLAEAAPMLGMGALVAGGSWLSSKFTPKAKNGDKLYGPQTGAPGAAGGGMGLPGGTKLKGSILDGLGDPAGYGQGAAGDNGSNPSIQSGASGGGNAASIINIAKRYLGKPYHWGGSNPKSSFDCSGLMQWVFGQAGIKLPRTAAQQQKVGKPVAKNEVRPGDLVFWGSPAHHVAMVIGAGQIIEAPHTGTNIRIRKFSTSEITNARRVVGSVGNVGDLSNSPATSNEGGSQTGSVGGDTGNFFGTGSDEASILAGLLSGGAPSSSGSAFGAPTTSTASTTGSGADSGVGSAPASVSGNAALGRKLAAARGWTGKEWNALYALWQGESGWNNKAQNPHSTAYGIAQFLNGTWGPYGAKTSDPTKQIQYGMSYIKDRYGDPLGAESFKKKHNWYDKGAWRIEGDQNAVVHDGEMVIPKADAETIRAALTRQPISQQKGSGRQVVLNFEPGSVVIQTSGVSTADMAAAGKQFVDFVAQDNRLKAVAAG